MDSAQLDQKLSRVGQIEKGLAALHAGQLHLIAAIADDPCDGTPAPVVEKDFVREELRALLRESAAAITDRIQTARVLSGRCHPDESTDTPARSAPPPLTA